MQVFDAIRTRLTVREFKPDAAPDEVVDKLLQTGRWAAEKMSTLRRLALNPAKGEEIAENRGGGEAEEVGLGL